MAEGTRSRLPFAPLGLSSRSVSSKRPPWLQNWLERHRSPLSFWLHMIGIPLAVAAVILAGYQLVL